MNSVSSSSKASAPVYEIRDAANKGKGMFAVRAIHAGEIIVQEVPVIVIAASSKPIERFVMRQYRKMDGAIRVRYNDLTSLTNRPEPTEAMKKDHNLTKLDDETGRVMGIFHNNAMTDGDRDGIYVALEASRINHSCIPNATYDLLSRELMVVRALTSIAKDKEVSVTYVGPMWKKEKRTETIWDSWRFVCMCQACTSKPLLDEATIPELDRALVGVRPSLAARLPFALIMSQNRICELHEDVKKGNADSSMLEQEEMQHCKFFVERLKGIDALMPNLAPILTIYVRLLEKNGHSGTAQCTYWYAELHRVLTVLKGPDHSSTVASTQAIEESKRIEVSKAVKKPKAVEKSRG